MSVNLTRLTPRKLRKQSTVSAPVDLSVPNPKYAKRNKQTTFIDPEDVSFALLAGPHEIRKLFRESQRTIEQIYNELEHVYKRYIPDHSAPAWQYKVGVFWDCNKSPMGLCMYNTVHDPMCDCCIFCSEPIERK